jgi:ABC-type nitrate/sulfonate/bicarbonate transport system permease component
MNRSITKLAWQLWLPVGLLIVWWFASAGSESLFFPPLSSILQEFWSSWVFEHFISDGLPSIGRLIVGFVIALFLGIGFGLLLGMFERVEVMIRPVVDFLRSTPSTALLPLLIMFFGTGAEMKTVMIAFVAVWPIILNTIDGVRSVEPMLNSVVQTFHINKREWVRFILLPSASPQIFAGARVGLAIAVIAMVVSEMVGRPGGIGYFILNAQRNFDLTAMWGGLIALGVIGFLANSIFKLVERRVLKWHVGLQNRHKEG